jgi:hypothetical protein
MKSGIGSNQKGRLAVFGCIPRSSMHDRACMPETLPRFRTVTDPNQVFKNGQTVRQALYGNALNNMRCGDSFRWDQTVVPEWSRVTDASKSNLERPSEGLDLFSRAFFWKTSDTD